MSKYTSCSIYYELDKLSGDKARCVDLLKTLDKRKLYFITWMMTVIERDYGIDDLSALSKEQIMALTKMPPAGVHQSNSNDNLLGALKELIAELTNARSAQISTPATINNEKTVIPTTQSSDIPNETRYISNESKKYAKEEQLGDDESDESVTSNQLSSFLSGLSDF